MTIPVKICGITRIEDALAAVDLGVHALGFVFHKKSPRYVAPARAADIILRLPPFVSSVALFVDADARVVENVLEHVPVSLLQFHGDEPPDFCSAFHRPYIKAVRVKPNMDLLQYAQIYRAARGLLLDAFVAGTHGGTGTMFDWSLFPNAFPLPLVLAGGLNPANVSDAIRRVRPSAVDVSSGVEASPGIKDALKMAAFVQGVVDADV